MPSIYFLLHSISLSLPHLYYHFMYFFRSSRFLVVMVHKYQASSLMSLVQLGVDLAGLLDPLLGSQKVAACAQRSWCSLITWFERLHLTSCAACETFINCVFFLMSAFHLTLNRNYLYFNLLLSWEVSFIFENLVSGRHMLTSTICKVIKNICLRVQWKLLFRQSRNFILPFHLKFSPHFSI